MLWLGGGPATIDMWDLKPERPGRHPRRVQADRHQAPTACRSASTCRRWRRSCDKCTIVRSLHHTIPSHGPATVFMTTGNKPTPALQYPSLGSLVTRLLPAEKGVPPYVTFSELRNGTAGTAGYLGTAYNPFIVEGAGGGKGKGDGRQPARPRHHAADRLHPRTSWKTATSCSTASTRPSTSADKSADLVDGLDAFHKQALEILRSDKTKKAFNLARRSTETARRATAPTAFGQGALAARRLVEAGVRFVTISLGGWDTHGQNFDALQDQPAAAARSDAVGPDRGPERPRHARTTRSSTAPASSAGRRRSTRTPAATTGRARWRCVLAGGGFKRGYAHGTTDAQGMAPATEPARRTTCRPRSSTASASTRTPSCKPDRPAGPAVPRRQGGREAAGVNGPR